MPADISKYLFILGIIKSSSGENYTIYSQSGIHKSCNTFVK